MSRDDRATSGHGREPVRPPEDDGGRRSRSVSGSPVRGATSCAKRSGPSPPGGPRSSNAASSRTPRDPRAYALADASRPRMGGGCGHAKDVRGSPAGRFCAPRRSVRSPSPRSVRSSPRARGPRPMPQSPRRFRRLRADCRSSETQRSASTSGRTTWRRRSSTPSLVVSPTRTSTSKSRASNGMDEAIARLQQPGADFNVLLRHDRRLAQIWIGAKLLRPLNHDYLPNVVNLWSWFRGARTGPSTTRASRIPSRTRSIRAGLGRRDDLVAVDRCSRCSRIRSRASWNDRYRGRLGVYDAYLEALSLALIRDGVVDLKAATDADLERAADALEEAVRVADLPLHDRRRRGRPSRGRVRRAPRRGRETS